MIVFTLPEVVVMGLLAGVLAAILWAMLWGYYHARFIIRDAQCAAISAGHEKSRKPSSAGRVDRL